MKPGSRLRALARRVCSQRTMEWLFDPLIADLQSEHDEVSRRRKPWANPVVPGGRSATALVGSLPFCYIIYMFQLGSVSRSVFSNESVAIAAVWLPNMILILASAAIITLADEARARDGLEVRSDS